jgi:hypothetical protein
LPRYEKIEFAHGENELIFPITLVNNKQPNNEGKTAEGNKIDEDDVEDEENEGVCDVTFKVKLEKPEPTSVKISKKNVCFVTIVQNEDVQKEAEEHAKMIEYFLDSKDPTWG